MKIGIDVSRYQRSVDYELLKAQGVDFLIAKTSQGDFKDPMYYVHQAGANSAGILFGGYHWLDPFVAIAKQVKVVLEQCRTGCQFVAIDFEQYGRTYLDLPPHKSSKDLTAILMEFNHQLSDQLRHVGLYSRATFMLAHAKEAISQLNKFDFLWWASYPNMVHRKLKHWSELNPPDPSMIYKPSGWTVNWDIWQFSGDRIQAPGVESRPGKPSNVDINMMTDSCFARLSAPLPSEWVRILARPYLNVRAKPSTLSSVVGRVYPGTIHDIIEWDRNGTWCRIREGWICAYLNVPYVEVLP